MEPMRPVDIGRQAPSKPWCQRWGWRLYAVIPVLFVATLRVAFELPLWAAVAVSVTLGVALLAIESLLTRELSR